MTYWEKFGCVWGEAQVGAIDRLGECDDGKERGVGTAATQQIKCQIRHM